MRCTRLFFLVATLTLTACTKPEVAPETVRSVRTLTVSAQPSGGAMEFAAEVRPRTESRLSFQVGGKVTRRLVDVGDRVKSGQTLAQINPQDLRLAELAAAAAAAAAQASLDQATADHKRYKDLFDQGFVGAAELDRRVAALKAARAQWDQSNAQSAAQANQSAYAALISDVAGIVTAVEVEPGTVVSAGTTVVRVAQDGQRDVVFAVPEDRVGWIRSASFQLVKVRLWGGAGETFQAVIREVAAMADPVTRTYAVKAELNHAASRIVRLGQTASVAVSLPSVPGVTLLPLSALRESGGQSAVWIVDSGAMTVASQVVSVAGAQGNEALITSGLRPGQIVVTAGAHVLTAGQKVRFYVDPGSRPVMTESAASAGTR